MKIKCFGCGEEHDTDVLEFYTGNLGIVKDKPIDPLWCLCAQPWSDEDPTWKVVVVCHKCFDRLEPDMWISSHCWAKLDPKVKWADLPDHTDENCGEDDPAQFAHIAVPA